MKQRKAQTARSREKLWLEAVFDFLARWRLPSGRKSIGTLGCDGAPDPPWLVHERRLEQEGQTPRVGRAYSPGFGWQSILFGVVIVAILAAGLVPKQVWERVLHTQPYGNAPSRPDVLLVSSRASDEATVAETLQPRGYFVRAALNVESGLEKLAQEPNRIGIVVLDGDLPRADRMVQAVNTTAPTARLIVFRESLGPDRISSLLINAEGN